MSNRFATRIVPLLLCTALLLGTATACAGSNSPPAPSAQQGTAQTAGGEAEKSGDFAANTAAVSQAAASGAPANPTAQAAAAQSGQKIIERLSYRMETLKFDEAVAAIQKLCGDLGGYVQNSNVDGRSADATPTLRAAKFTLRIPQEKLADWKSHAGTLATVLNFTSTSENVSDSYYDTEARLKSLRTQQDRLLSLLGKSGTMSDIVTLEKALEDVNYQIEQLTGTLRQYDSQVRYSTVTVDLTEVLKPTEQTVVPVTLGQKISARFQATLHGLGGFGEGLLIFFLGDAPVLLLLALIAAAAVWLYLRRKKRRESVRKEQLARPYSPILPDDPQNPQDPKQR